MHAVVGVGQKICAVLEEFRIQEKAITVSFGLPCQKKTGHPQIVSRNAEFIRHGRASLVCGNLVILATARVRAVSSRRRNGTNTVSMRAIRLIHCGYLRCSSHNSRYASEAIVSHWVAHADSSVHQTPEIAVYPFISGVLPLNGCHHVRAGRIDLRVPSEKLGPSHILRLSDASTSITGPYSVNCTV